MRRKHDHRFRAGGAEGTCSIEGGDKVRSGAGRRQCRIDKKRSVAAHPEHSSSELLVQKGPEGTQAIGIQRHAGRHGMAAAAGQQPHFDRPPDGLPKVDPRDGAARAGSTALGQGNGEDRTLEPLPQTRRDEAHDARMPAFAGGDQHRTVGIACYGKKGLGFGPLQCLGLDPAPLTIQAVEFHGDPPCFRRVAGEQQPGSQSRIANPAAGVDPGADQETEVEDARRAVRPRHVEKRGQSRTLAPVHEREALDDQRPVQPDQRNDVGDRSERHEIETGEKIRCRPCPPRNRKPAAGDAKRPAP